MKRKTKTQEAAEYIENQLGIVVFQPEALRGYYYVTGLPDPVQSPYGLRQYARQVCMMAMVQQINEQLGLSLQFDGSLPWYATIQDDRGCTIDVTNLVRERSAGRLNIHDTSAPKAAVIDAFQFSRALAAIGVHMQRLSQELDGTWSARQRIVWASKRGFLHDAKRYAIVYGASPVRTVLVEGSDELHRFDGQWVTLDRLTKLIPFA